MKCLRAASCLDHERLLRDAIAIQTAANDQDRGSLEDELEALFDDYMQCENDPERCIEGAVGRYLAERPSEFVQP